MYMIMGFFVSFLLKGTIFVKDQSKHFPVNEMFF